MNINFVDVDYKPGKPLTIIPLEVHWSRRTRSNGFCKDTWNKVLKRIEIDPDCRVIFCGDLCDADRPSNRERRARLGEGRPEVLDEDDMDFMDGLDQHLLPDLKRIKDKIIGAVDGDHFRILGNKTSTQYLLEKLGKPKAYLGERMGWVRLTFRRKGGNCSSFDIFVRHGKGASSTFGTDVNSLTRQSMGFDANLYIGGHTHKQWFIKTPYLYVGKYDIKQRYVGYARAGSLLRGFLCGQPTYAELAEYSPLSVGWPEISVYTKRDPDTGNIIVSDLKGLT